MDKKLRVSKEDAEAVKSALRDLSDISKRSTTPSPASSPMLSCPDCALAIQTALAIGTTLAVVLEAAGTVKRGGMAQLFEVRANNMEAKHKHVADVLRAMAGALSDHDLMRAVREQGITKH